MKLFELQSPAEVQELENLLDDLMRPVGLDVEFSRHFIERLLARESKVTIDEIRSSFAKLKQRYKKRLLHAKKVKGYQAVLKDFSNELNIVFAIKGGEMTNITMMRKNPRNFLSSNFGSEDLEVR